MMNTDNKARMVALLNRRVTMDPAELAAETHEALGSMMGAFMALAIEDFGIGGAA